MKPSKPSALQRGGSPDPSAAPAVPPTDFVTLTEVPGELGSEEQVERMTHRYAWASRLVEGMEVLEVACGGGPGLALLAKRASRLVAGDISAPLLHWARAHYGPRTPLVRLDAMRLPFDAGSFDAVICCEATCFIPSVDAFVAECARVLRPRGLIILTTANKDLYDFAPAPHSHEYHGAIEFPTLLARHGFDAEMFGHTAVNEVPLRQRALRPVKFLAVRAGAVPRTMRGKEPIKRLMFGPLVRMPAEVAEVGFSPPPAVLAGVPDRCHKILYCLGRRRNVK